MQEVEFLQFIVENIEVHADDMGIIIGKK